MVMMMMMIDVIEFGHFYNHLEFANRMRTERLKCVDDVKSADEICPLNLPCIMYLLRHETQAIYLIQGITSDILANQDSIVIQSFPTIVYCFNN